MVSIVTIGIVPIIILLFAVLTLFDDNARANKAKEVKGYAHVATNILSSLAAEVSANSNGEISVANALNEADLSEMDTIAQIYGGRVLVVNNDLLIIKDTNVQNKESVITNISYTVSEDIVDCISDKKTILANRDREYTELITPIKDVDGNTIGAVVLGYSNENIMLLYEVLKNKSLVILTIVIMLLILLALYYSNKISKSFMKITQSIAEVKEGFLDAIEPVNDFTETQDLSEAFNAMLERIERLENSRQEFVSNVSHELKTPITSMKVLADSLISQEGLPAELYREFMVDITDELDRENKIITDLLALVKLDKTASELNVSSISINELLEMILKRVRPLAAKRNIEIVFESFRPVEAEVDEIKLSLALSNLIENAVKYNYEDGWIKVSLNADHKYFYVKVEDSGVGIPEDCQEQIFERFYRVDKARSRDTGGTGLGLAITRNVIILHKGVIRVKSKEKQGTTFTIRIPLTYILESKQD